ncbi:MAG: hypothetical protein NTAFB01_44410 [Nitrospira sp.]
MAADTIEPIERWTAKQRIALVVRILKRETSVAEAAQPHGLTVAENALRTRPKDEEASKTSRSRS